MIFDKVTAERIASGRKTQHRIPRKLDADLLAEAGPRDVVTVTKHDGTGDVHLAAAVAGRTLPYAPGDTIPVTVMEANKALGYRRPKFQTPRREGVEQCQVRILACAAAFLHEVTEADARAEGFKFKQDLLDHWLTRHQLGCGKPGNLEYPILVPVWVLWWVRVDTDHGRLLSTASDVNRGYTESPVLSLDREAGGAVTDEDLDRFALDSDQDKVRRLLDQEQRIRERSTEDRLAAVKEAARREGVDIARQLAAIERRVAAAEHIVRKFGKAA